MSECICQRGVRLTCPAHGAEATAMLDETEQRHRAAGYAIGERAAEDAIEAAYWTFDARRAGRYKRDPHGVLGAQEERDAFKAAVREHVTPALRLTDDERAALEFCVDNVWDDAEGRHPALVGLARQALTRLTTTGRG